MQPRLGLLLATAARRRFPSRGDAVELTVSMAIAVGVRVFAVDARYIPTTSMEPTFAIGDHLLLDKASRAFRPPRRGDVVCFRPSEEVHANLTDGSCYIKRVVGVEGDVLQARPPPERPPRPPVFRIKTCLHTRLRAAGCLSTAKSRPSRMCRSRCTTRCGGRSCRPATSSCSATTATTRTTRMCGAACRRRRCSARRYARTGHHSASRGAPPTAAAPRRGWGAGWPCTVSA